MSDEKELHRLLIANLADIEAASHEIVNGLQPLIFKSMKKIIGEFIAEQDWYGAVDDVDDFWFAPKNWRIPDGKNDSFLCQFVFDYLEHDEERYDDWWLTSVTGNGELETALFWSRNYLNKVGPWKKLLDDNADALAELRAAGFLYDGKNGRNLFNPFKIDPEALRAGISDETFEEALAPLRRVLDAAAKAAPLLEPFVTALRAA